MNIPDKVLSAASQRLWDVDSIPQDAEWDELAPSFRASLMTQVEAAAQPIAEWARKEALAELRNVYIVRDVDGTSYTGQSKRIGATLSKDEAAQWAARVHELDSWHTGHVEQITLGRVDARHVGGDKTDD